MSKQKQKQLRKFKYFSAFGEEACIQQVNSWVEDTGCYIVNYSILSSQGSGQIKMLVFYENEDGGVR